MDDAAVPPDTGAGIARSRSFAAPFADSMQGTVLHVLGPSTGGIRRHVAELTRQIGSLGWRSVVAGPVGVMDGIGPQQVALGTTDDWSVRRMVRVRRMLRQHVRSVDLVHAHGIKAAAAVAWVRGRAPMVVTLHNDMVGTHAGARARLRGTVQNALLRRADHVIHVSRAGAEAHRRHQRWRQSSVIMSFAAPATASATRSDTRVRLGVDDAPLVVVVARLHPQKDLSMFLRAFAEVLQLVPAARAVVAGDGPLRTELEALQGSLGLADVVDFVGATDQAADLVAAADVFAISSRWEAGPITAVEAMQLGIPVVMTDTGAVAELAGPLAAAIVTPTGDAKAFASALVSLLTGPDRRDDLSARGRALATAEFDPSVLVHRVDAVYRGLRRGSDERRSGDSS